MKKSKKARQKWWRDLSDTQRSDYLEGIVKRKGEKRRANSIKVMVKYGRKYECAKCFHGQGGNCTDNLPNGCEHWYHPKSKKMGIAYKRTA